MKSFFNYNFNITNVVLSCCVKACQAETLHTNRNSHCLALHTSGKKEYCFSEKLKLEVEQNNIIFLPKHSNYTVKNIAQGTCFAINFELSEDTEFEPFVLKIKNRLGITEKFKNTEKAFRLKPLGYEMMCKAELYSIICIMLSEYNSEYIPNSRKNIILPAIDYIQNEYVNQTINIEHLAELCGISVAYFRRIFISQFGVSPIKYINTLKINRAKELISSGLYTINDVMILCGFSEISYFCRCFKKSTGLTPTQFRLAKTDV